MQTKSQRLFWKRKALEFAKAFVQEYERQEVTTYLHIFVYHVGFYVEKYGSLERFANYGIEGLHAKNKKVVKMATFGYKKGAEVTKQELEYSHRMEHYCRSNISSHKKEKYGRHENDSWVTAILELEEEWLELSQK